MMWIKLLVFILAIFFTLDYLVDTIEVNSGKSEEHKRIGKTQTDLRYGLVPVILWTTFYILNIIPYE